METLLNKMLFNVCLIGSLADWLISLLIELCVRLQFIPMPVLYGVFLYMGASSLRGIQVSSHSPLTDYQRGNFLFQSKSPFLNIVGLPN